MKDVDQSLNSSKSIGPLIFSPEHIASWSLIYPLVFDSCYWRVQISPNTVVLLPGETFSYCWGKYDSYLIEHLKRIIRALISCLIRALQNKLMRLQLCSPELQTFQMWQLGVWVLLNVLATESRWAYRASPPNHMDSTTTDNKHLRNLTPSVLEMGKYVVLKMESEIQYCDLLPRSGLNSIPSNFMPTQNHRTWPYLEIRSFKDVLAYHEVIVEKAGPKFNAWSLQRRGGHRDLWRQRQLRLQAKRRWWLATTRSQERSLEQSSLRLHGRNQPCWHLILDSGLWKCG